MIGAGLLVTLLGINGELSRFDSVFLFSLLAGYFYYSVWTARKERTEALSECKNQRIEVDIELSREIFLFIIGAACVVFGSRWLVKSAELIARKLGVFHKPFF